MLNETICPKCGAALGIDARQGFCPKCLFAQAQFDDASIGIHPVPTGQSVPTDEPSASILGDIQLPRKFADYELLEEIARGGMGIVYRARQINLDRIVALKMLLFGRFASPEFVKRFRAEASAAASLQHPNIVAIHEVGMHQGQQYFAMDYVQGQNLSKQLVNGPLSARNAASYLKTIAEAIHYAHEHGILHRDLKPSNVLIDPNNQPRVTDFGLAQRLEGGSELTVTGQVLGSPNYMSPEQAVGRRAKVSRRSDIYSLGAMLYHLLTGRPPFLGETLTDTLEQVLNSEPVSPRLLNPGIPRDLETICLKSLEKEPGRRYSTAQMLADELGRFLQDEPVHARPIMRPERILRWCRRKPALASSIAAITLLVFGILIGSPIAIYRINQARKAEEVQRKRAEIEEMTARRNQYASDINLAAHELAMNDLGRAEQLLTRQKADLRGWEWRYLWQQCHGDALASLCMRSNAISSISLSADGHWLAIGESHDNALSIWNLKTRTEETHLVGRARPMRAVFSPRGTLLAFLTLSHFDSTNYQHVVQLWDLETRSNLVELPLNGPCAGLAFSGDGHRLLTSTSGSAGEIAVWQVPEGIRLTTHPAPQVNWDVATPFALTSDMSAAAHGTPTDQVRVIDLFSGQERWSAKASEEGVKTVTFSPNGKLLATGAGFVESTIRLWDAASGREVNRLEGHRGWISALLFWPDGKTLASASSDQTIRIWDLSNPTNVPSPQILRGHKLEVWRLALLPDNRTLLSGGKDGRVLFWDTTFSNRQPLRISLPERLITWRFASNSQSILSLNRKGVVARWSGPAFQERESLLEIGTNSLFLSSLISEDCRILASASPGVVDLWDLPTRSRLLRLTHGTYPQPIAFRDGRKTLVTVDRWDGTYREWNLANGQEMRIWHGLDNLTWSCTAVFSPNERWCFSLDKDGVGCLRDMVTGRETRANLSVKTAMCVAFSPDGQLIVGAGAEGTVTFWDPFTLLKVGPHLRGFLQGITSMAFSPDGTRLAAGSDGTQAIKIWDFATRQELLTLEGEGSLFCRTAFSPDGTVLGSMNERGLLHLWRAPLLNQIE